MRRFIRRDEMCCGEAGAALLSYPMQFQEDDRGVLVTSPDFPELTTFGDDMREALDRSASALEEAVASRMHNDLDVPVPSDGDARVPLPTLTAVKVILCQGMRDQNIGKSELARRLGWRLPQVDRALDVEHRSRLDRMDIALGAIGMQLTVKTEEMTGQVESAGLLVCRFKAGLIA